MVRFGCLTLDKALTGHIKIVQNEQTYSVTGYPVKLCTKKFIFYRESDLCWVSRKYLLTWRTAQMVLVITAVGTLCSTQCSPKTIKSVLNPSRIGVKILLNCMGLEGRLSHVSVLNSL